MILDQVEADAVLECPLRDRRDLQRIELGKIERILGVFLGRQRGGEHGQEHDAQGQESGGFIFHGDSFLYFFSGTISLTVRLPATR